MKRAFLMIMISFICVFAFAEWTIIETYSIPGKSSGLAWDGTYLYSGIYGVNGSDIYQIDPSNGSYQLQFSDPVLDDTYGLTYDEVNLWLTDHRNGASQPAVAYKYDMIGNILSEFNLPDHYMSGIAYDNGNFWAATYYPDDPSVIYQLDDSGNVLQQFNFDIPGNDDEQPWDLCMQGNDIWIVDYNAEILFKVDTSGTILEEHPSENIKPAGVVFDGTYLWYVDGALNSNSTLYKVDLGGTGTPVISLDWDDYDFGNTTVGQPATVELPISNTGTADLVVSDLNFTLDDFSTDETLPITIIPGSTENFTIIFDPFVWGPYSCNLEITSNDPVNPLEIVTLSGYGVTNDPLIVVNPTNLNYGNIRVGALTGRYLEISNQGSGNLEITQFQFDNTQFILDETVILPITLTPASADDFRIWFNPQTSGNINATLTIHSNDPANSMIDIALSGSGDNTQYAIGSILWQYQIDTSYDNSPKAIAPIEDVNGDDVGDVIICSEDNFVRCFNGNASITGDILWEYEISAGDVYNQNSLVISSDLDGDDHDDVVIGTVGGDRATRAISGKTGQLIWVFYTSSYGGSGGWVYQVDVSYDYNSDGILDVLAAAGSDAQRIMCLDGSNGNELWNFYATGPKFSCLGISDFTSDGIPDVIGGGSNADETEGKVWGINGSNGSQIWEFTTGSSSVWALSEVDDFSGNGLNDIVAGDFSGNYYGLESSSGSMNWSGSVGTCFIIRLETLNDVNGDGHPDIAIARSSIDNAVVIDGFTGQNIWLQPLADQPWVVDKIGDITGDGINDVIWGTLFGSNYGYFMDGATGEILSQTPVGSACDAIGGIPDVAGDGSWEMICGGRDGEVICISGGEAASSSPEISIPEHTDIAQLIGNYPNPFNPNTKISFDLVEDAEVRLQIYNTKGQLVRTLIRSTLEAGYHSAIWNGTDDKNKAVASGLYFYKMQTGSYTSTGKCLLLK